MRMMVVVRAKRRSDMGVTVALVLNDDELAGRSLLIDDEREEEVVGFWWVRCGE